MEVVNQYLNDVVQTSRLPNQEQAVQLSRLLNLNPQINPYIVRFSNINFVISEQQINIDSYNIYSNEWLALNEVIISFVKLSNQLNPWSNLESFDLYTTYLNDLSIAFNNNSRGFLLSYVMKDSINTILPITIKLDHLLYHKEHCVRPRLAFLASVLLKVFNNIRSQVNDTNQFKKTIILFISNKLCLVYFKLDNPLLCRNIFSNMNNANLSFKSFDKVERIQYRYYLSKFHLIKDQLIDSFQHLLWCLLNTPPQLTNNITRVLKFLVPVSIVIGKIPNFDTLAATYYPNGNVPEFLHLYKQLNQSIKSGNYRSFNEVITNNYQYLKEENLLIMLIDKSKLIILRNLVRKIWVMRGKYSNLDYDDIKLGLQLSMGQDVNALKLTFPIIQSLDLIDDFLIENIFISLIDQNLLKGKIFPRLRKVALSKTNAFAKIDEINFVRFGSKKHNWMDS